jgi:translation initiation factor eIF-2B subunit epsilon
VSPTSTSVGDAMRDLDQKQVITHDFLLIHGDFIGNLSLDSVLEEHNKRRAISSKAIMTMVLREAGTAHRSK